MVAIPIITFVLYYYFAHVIIFFNCHYYFCCYQCCLPQPLVFDMAYSLAFYKLNCNTLADQLWWQCKYISIYNLKGTFVFLKLTSFSNSSIYFILQERWLAKSFLCHKENKVSFLRRVWPSFCPASSTLTLLLWWACWVSCWSSLLSSWGYTAVTASSRFSRGERWATQPKCSFPCWFMLSRSLLIHV